MDGARTSDGIKKESRCLSGIPFSLTSDVLASCKAYHKAKQKFCQGFWGCCCKTRPRCFQFVYAAWQNLNSCVHCRNSEVSPRRHESHKVPFSLCSCLRVFVVRFLSPLKKLTAERPEHTERAISPASRPCMSLRGAFFAMKQSPGGPFSLRNGILYHSFRKFTASRLPPNPVYGAGVPNPACGEGGLATTSHKKPPPPVIASVAKQSPGR